MTANRIPKLLVAVLVLVVHPPLYSETGSGVAEAKGLTPEAPRSSRDPGADGARLEQLRTAMRAEIERLRSEAEGEVVVRGHEIYGTPGLVRGDWWTDPRLHEPRERAREFVRLRLALFGLSAERDAFEPDAVWTGRHGLTNVVLHQTRWGVRVFGADLIVHLDGPRVKLVNGSSIPGIDADPEPSSTAEEAVAVAKNDLLRRLSRVRFEGEPDVELVYYDTGLRTGLERGEVRLCWFVRLRTLRPGGAWRSMVDARSGEIVEAWNAARSFHPSEVYDALYTSTTSDDRLWYRDGRRVASGAPPQEAIRLERYGGNYALYLRAKFGLNGIDDRGSRLVGRINDPEASRGVACWDCRRDEAIFSWDAVTQDIVAHEYTHGLVEKLAGGLDDSLPASALNEGVADLFAELFECWMGGCNWRAGTDEYGRTNGANAVRDLTDPPIDHISLYDPTATPHANSGILSKVGYLLAEGGFHGGIRVEPLGVEKTEQLLYSTLVDTGVTSSAGFGELRDVMLETCRLLAGGSLQRKDCRIVSRAWCSVGFCALGQDLAGAVNEDGDRLGWSLAVGDFNGDTYADLAVGAPFDSIFGEDSSGLVVIFYGSWTGLPGRGTELLRQDVAAAMNEKGDRFGSALAAGDFDGDSFDDLGVGVPNEDLAGGDDTGVVNIFFGSRQGLRRPGGAARWQRLDQEVLGGSDEEGDGFGGSLAIGDFDDDGYADLVIGVPSKDVGGERDGGAAYVVYGSSTGLVHDPVAELLTQERVGAVTQAMDQFGASFAVGDYDGDGIHDLAVGVPGKDVDSADSAGMVDILYGSAAGLLPAKYERLHQGTAGSTVEEGDRFSHSLAAGDFDSDGHDDLVVGAPLEDLHGVENAGLVNVLFGSSRGLFPVRSEVLSQGDVGGADEKNDRFGWSLTTAHFNDGRHADLVIGMPNESVGELGNAGVVHVVFGCHTGLSPVIGRRSRSESAVGGQTTRGNWFGWDVAAGDFDGDGRDEVAASSPLRDFASGVERAGAVFVMEE